MRGRRRPIRWAMRLAVHIIAAATAISLVVAEETPSPLPSTRVAVAPAPQTAPPSQLSPEASDPPHGSTGFVRTADVELYAVGGEILIDLSDRQLTYILDGNEIASTTIAIGSPDNPTPTGTFFRNRQRHSCESGQSLGALRFGAFSQIRHPGLTHTYYAIRQHRGSALFGIRRDHE